MESFSGWVGTSGATSTFVKGGGEELDFECLGRGGGGARGSKNFSKNAVFRIWSNKQYFLIVEGLALWSIGFFLC